MARPRAKATKDLPTGLWFIKSRGIYRFTRVDGSTKSLGKDKARAIKLARVYNGTYRVDPLISHALAEKKETATTERKYQTLSHCLPDIIERIVADKKWSENHEINQRNAAAYIKSYFADMCGASITIVHVNGYLASRTEGATPQQYNRVLTLLTLVFDYLVDQSYMTDNPARNKIRKTTRQKDESSIERLSTEQFRAIHALAGGKGLQWLQIAMELSLQTSQAVLEVSRIKYADINDFIKIQRQKNQRKAASRIAIPLNDELQDIVRRSRQDNVLSPFVVHRQRAPKYQHRPLGKGIEHNTQLPSDKISRKFAELRDQLGYFNHINNRKDRPGFHDIRALSIFWQEENGYDAQKRAAHSERQSTDIYKKGHIQWNEVSDVVIVWKAASEG